MTSQSSLSPVFADKKGLTALTSEHTYLIPPQSSKWPIKGPEREQGSPICS